MSKYLVALNENKGIEIIARKTIIFENLLTSVTLNWTKFYLRVFVLLYNKVYCSIAKVANTIE